MGIQNLDKFIAEYRRHFEFPFRQRKEQAEKCRTFWAKDCEQILKTANELCNHIFLFQLPWDMEQTHEAVRFHEEIQWDYVLNEDEEFTFQMNRHRYFICLGQAYALTLDEKFAECFVRLLLHWSEKEPYRIRAEKTTWRSLEAGLRTTYWIRSMAFFTKSPHITEHVWHVFFAGIKKHAEYLFHNKHIGFSNKSNWGVMENGGLYFAGLVLQEKRYTERASVCLKRMLRIQVMDDGMQWEQSGMYHNEVLMSYLEVMRISEVYAEHVFDEQERTVIRAMAKVTMVSQNPQGRQPMMGDSDDTNVKDMVTLSAWLFRDSELKSGGYEVFDFETVWMYGSEAFCEYKEIKPAKFAEGLTVLNHSGQIYYRSGWDTKADWLHFVNGPMGGGHGHYDKLHFDLCLNGEEVLIDSGRYTYRDIPLRYELKGARAHNVPMVHGKEYGSCVDSWLFSALPESIGNSVQRKKEYLFIEGAHFGYEKNGILLKRKILCIGHDIYIVMDEFLGKEVTLCSQMYHFSEQISLDISEGGVYGRGNNVKFFMKSYAEDCVVDIKTKKSPVSRHYNQCTEATEMEICANHTRTMTTILVKEDGVKRVAIEKRRVHSAAYDKYLDSRFGEGFVITTGSQTYGVVFLHQDVGNQYDYVGIEHLYGIGRVMAASLDEEDMTVLQW